MTQRVHLPLAEATRDDPAALPTLQARWVHALLDGAEVPRETGATCDDCAMLPPPGEHPTQGHWFNPSMRCCTYVP